MRTCNTRVVVTSIRFHAYLSSNLRVNRMRKITPFLHTRLLLSVGQLILDVAEVELELTAVVAALPSKPRRAVGSAVCVCASACGCGCGRGCACACV